MTRPKLWFAQPRTFTNFRARPAAPVVRSVTSPTRSKFISPARRMGFAADDNIPSPQQFVDVEPPSVRLYGVAACLRCAYLAASRWVSLAGPGGIGSGVPIHPVAWLHGHQPLSPRALRAADPGGTPVQRRNARVNAAWSA